MRNKIIANKRVYGPGPIPGINVLVAVPGDEIDVELARRLGLLDEPAKAPAKKTTKKPSANASGEPTTNATPYASYPTKKSSGK